MDESKNRWRDWRCLALLLMLVLPLRVWLLYNTEVAARDSIGFIRYALQFESKPWQEVLLGNHQHPGYPLAVWAVSQPVRALAGTDALSMRISAQLASTLAALALLVPMYYLGKELFDRQIGFWSALFFQYLPVSGHHLSDGISEALFLFFVAMALWRGVVAVRSYRPGAFAWCGVWCGLAYLTRPEGALILMTVGAVLAGMQLIKPWRKHWLPFAACASSLGAAALAVGSIYFLTTGHFTNKPAVRDIRNFIARHDSHPIEAFAPGRGEALVGGALFGAFIQRTDYFPVRLSRALRAMAAEFTQGFNYFGWLPALLALCWNWRGWGRDASFWVPAAYCLLHGSVLLLLAMVEFYVSDRHMMVLILCGSFFTIVGMRECAARGWAWWHKRRREPCPSLTLRALTIITLMLTIAVCVPKTMQRLHGNRVGNHQAGLWLAPKLAKGDVVIDDHAYSHYYAGQLFEEEKKPVLPKDCQPTCYVVVTRTALESDTGRKAKEDDLRQHAKLVYRWPENRAIEEARVVIYAQPRTMEQNPWTVGP